MRYNQIMKKHLSELRESNPKAFQAYVDMLVEDCEAEFVEFPDGIVHCCEDCEDDGCGCDGYVALEYDPERNEWEMDEHHSEC